MSIVTSLLEALWSLLMGLLGKSATPRLATATASSRAAPAPRPAPPPADEDDEDADAEEDEYDPPAAMAAAQQQMQAMMSAALPTDSPLLQPIEGVTVQTWAAVAATLSTLGDDRDAYHRTLAQHDLDATTYESAQAQWMLRMQSAHDPMAAAAIAQIYGAAFTEARTAAAPSDGAEPCTLERYAELMGAQGAWASDGHDVNAMLQQTFGMTAAQYSDIGAYWSQRILSDVQLSVRLNELIPRFEEQYRSTDDPDADLVL